MKKHITFPLILVILLTLSGCSNRNYTIGSLENSTSTMISMSYLRFNGVKSKTLTVEEGKSIDVAVDIVTEDGSINATIFNENNENSYEGQDIQTSSFTVTLTEPGKYTIRIEADKHKGSYSFSWK